MRHGAHDMLNNMVGPDDLLLQRADNDHVVEFVNEWVPWYTLKRLANPAWSYRMFPWDQIIQRYHNTVVAAVDQGGALEGLMSSHAEATQVKINFLSTAPWNHGSGRRRRGVGAAMLSVAIMQSARAGFDGAIYLSSTPESESFYKRLQFVDTGQRDAESLRIFRLPGDRARKHVGAYPPIQTDRR